MNFTQKKLPKEAAGKLSICPIESVAPYSLMLAPIYVFLKRNEKFVSVKAPLDFFLPEELDRLRTFENFFIPSSISSIIPFYSAARSVRKLLQLSGDSIESSELVSTYELSDLVLRLIGPLWGRGLVIEPYFVSVFVNELCDPLPSSHLLEARDKDINLYECSLFRSSSAVFFALHLGFCNLDYLNQLRIQSFENNIRGRSQVSTQDEAHLIVDLCRELISDSDARAIKGDWFKEHQSILAQKIYFRLNRVTSEFIKEESPVPSIFGPGGFCND